MAVCRKCQVKNIGQFEPKCLKFKTAPLDFSGFHGHKYAKTLDKTIPLSEIITHCPPSFFHIHRPKAANRGCLLMALNSQSILLVN